MNCQRTPFVLTPAVARWQAGWRMKDWTAAGVRGGYLPSQLAGAGRASYFCSRLLTKISR